MLNLRSGPSIQSYVSAQGVKEFMASAYDPELTETFVEGVELLIAWLKLLRASIFELSRVHPLDRAGHTQPACIYRM
jgi:hypothetical protein